MFPQHPPYSTSNYYSAPSYLHTHNYVCTYVLCHLSNFHGHLLNGVAGEVQLLQAGHAAQRQGKLLQAVVGQREGDETMEDIDVVNPTDGFGMAEHSLVCILE